MLNDFDCDVVSSMTRTALISKGQTMSKVLNISIAVLLLASPIWAGWTEADGQDRTAMWDSSDEVSLELAVVITPEPITLLVLALGLIPALLKRRKKVQACGRESP